MALGVAYTLTIRCQITNQPGMLGRLTTAIGEAGGDIGAIDIVRAERSQIVRDVTVRVQDEGHGATLIATIGRLPGIKVVQVSDRVFQTHQGGKLAIRLLAATIYRWPTRPAWPVCAARSPTTPKMCTNIPSSATRWRW
jgi:malate dehydrogenase (oxaloacetate-decarboxylating)